MKMISGASVILLCIVLAIGQKSTELYGHIKYTNGTAASGVGVSIGNYSVTTDKDGYYKMGFLKPGVTTVWITPPYKKTRSFRVVIGRTPTQKDFMINW